MGHTTVDLYRKGNASSARLDHVRRQDIQHYQRNGIEWLKARTGGVSTFAAPVADGGRWWRLPAGYDYGGLLLVWNDEGDHWLWEPLSDMPLSDFRNLLGIANLAFQ